MMVSMDRVLPIMRVHVAIVLAAVAVLIAAWLGIALVLDSDTGPATQADARVGSLVGHGPSYSSLVELVANSELVAVGTVTSSTVGKIFDDDPTGQYPTRLLHTVVSIDEVMRGIAPGEVTVVTDELAFAAPNLSDWREPGTQVLLFLTQSTETPGYHVLTNLNYTQTAYVVQGDDLEAAVADRLSDRIAEMSLSAVRRKVGQIP